MEKQNIMQLQQQLLHIDLESIVSLDPHTHQILFQLLLHGLEFNEHLR